MSEKGRRLEGLGQENTRDTQAKAFSIEIR